MKLNDVNKDLQEAPDFKAGAKKFAQKAGKKAKELGGKAAAATKLELQRNTPFNKNKRDIAYAKTDAKKQATSIKKEFQLWMASAESEGAAPTAENFINFITNEKSDLAPFVKDVGKAFGFTTDPKKEKGDVEGGKADTVDSSKEQGDMVAPEEMTGEKPKRELSPDEQAGFDKINKDAEDEAAEFDKQDLKASKGEDKEPKVDTSASIYESRLAAMLFERELSDNDVDTFIVRLLQAKKKGGAKAALASATSQEEPAQQEKPKQEQPKQQKGKTEKPNQPKQKGGNADYFLKDIMGIIQKADPEVAKKIYKPIEKLVRQFTNS